MNYPTDPTHVPSAMKGNFKRNASGEGFGKKSAMPLKKPCEYPKKGDAGNKKYK